MAVAASAPHMRCDTGPLDQAESASESSLMDDAPATPAPPAEPAPQAAPAAAAAPDPPSAAPGEPAAPAGKEARKAKPATDESWWGTLRFLIYLLIAAVLIRTFIFAPFSIPSASMLPNLVVGDHLFVAKWPYGYSRYSLPFAPIGFDGRVPDGVPERGDVVVFRHPRNEDWVKRVIGLPGDTIEVRGGVVILNGLAVPRQPLEPFDLPVSPNSPCDGKGADVRLETGADGQPHCLFPRYRETLPGGRSYEVLDQGRSPADDFGPITVPAGHLFMMGDNRDDSLDSRVSVEQHGVGLLPIQNVLGRALIGFWSTDGSAEWIKPWTWFTAARWSRIFRTY
jgi:signal peptidase I